MSEDNLYMLWTDESGTIEEKAKRAIQHYRNKYGVPSVVIVNKRIPNTPKVILGLPVQVEDLGSNNVLAIGELEKDPRNESLG